MKTLKLTEPTAEPIKGNQNSEGKKKCLNQFDNNEINKIELVRR